MRILIISLFISIFHLFNLELKANCPIIGPDKVCQDSKNVLYKASMGGNSFVWSIESGDATISGASNLESVVINVGKLDFKLKLVDGNDSCIFNVIVNQNPVGSASSQIICSGTTTNLILASTIPGTTFTWTAIQFSGTTITGFSDCTTACGTAILQMLTNTSNSMVGVVRYTVTPTSPNGCIGNAFTVDVTVNPKPGGSASPLPICSGSTTNVVLNSTIPGTTFTWIATQFSGSTISGFSDCTTACGTAISQMLTNTSNSMAGVVRYTVTPTSPNGCAGNTFTIDVTIKALPIPKLIIKDLGNIKFKSISDTSIKVNGITRRTIRVYKDGKNEMKDTFQKDAFYEYPIRFILGSKYKICLIIEDANSCSDSTCTEFMISSENCNDAISIKETSALKNRCLNDTTKLDLIIKPSNKFTDSLFIALYANDSVYSSFLKKDNTDTIYKIYYLNKKCDKIIFRAKVIGKIGGGKIDSCFTADDPEIKVNCLPIKKLLLDSYCFNQNDQTINIKYKFSDIDSNNLAKNNKSFKVRVFGDSVDRDADAFYSLPFVIKPDFNKLQNTKSIIWEFIRNDSTQCKISNDTDVINLYLKPDLRNIDTTACQGTKLSIPIGYVINSDIDFKWKSTSAIPWNENKLIVINSVLIGPNTYQYIILNNLSGNLMCGDSGNFTVTGKESPKIKIIEIDKCIGFYKAEITNQSEPDKFDWLPHGDDPRIDSIKPDLIRIIPNKGIPDSLCSAATLGTCSNTDCIPINRKLIGDTTEARLSKIDCKDSILIFTKQNGCFKWISIDTLDNSWEVIDSKNSFIIRDSNYIKSHIIILRTYPCDDTSKCGSYELFNRLYNTRSDCHEHFNGSINFYPNPSAGFLTLNFENLVNGLYSVKIYNTIGYMVYNNSLTIDNHNLINKIKLSENLPSGMYRILIENNFGNHWLKNIAVIR